MCADFEEVVSGACGRHCQCGEKAVELLTLFQVNTILLYPRSQQDRSEKYFVLNQTLSCYELENLASELKEHNARIPSGSVQTGRSQGAFACSSG